MISSATLPLPRKAALLLVEFLIKILWVLDRVTSLEIGYIFKTLYRTVVTSVALSFLIFLGYSMSTGFLQKVYMEYMVPDYALVSYVAISYPRLVSEVPAPDITAVSAIAVDRDKGRVLYEKNPDQKLQPASTVKLMSSLVAFKLYNPEDILSVSEECTMVEGTKAYYPSGTSYKAGDLIDMMLIGSTGDSACVLATSKVNESEFVDMMNEKASDIGMESTLFSNPIGLDADDGVQYSTARDLYKLAVYATSNSEIKDIVKKSSFLVSSTDETYRVYLPSTNRFLWEVPNTVGIKTGTTQGAGEVLIYEYDDGVKDIVIVVMGSKDRFSDTKRILDWVINSYRWTG